jgi:hypothetical protein
MGLTGGKISIAMLSQAPGVYAELEDFPFDIRFQVMSFTVVTIEGILTKQTFSNASIITREQSDAIIKADKGSNVYIEDIVIKSPENKTYTIPPIKFTLK